VAANLEFSVASDWGAGFTGAFAVVNGADPVEGWMVEFDASFQIMEIWNAELVSGAGGHYVVRNPRWNGSLGSREMAGFGFNAAPGGAAPAQVSNLAFNGGAVPPALPTLAVGDAALVEGEDGTGQMEFTVTLFAPAEESATLRQEAP